MSVVIAISPTYSQNVTGASELVFFTSRTTLILSESEARRTCVIIKGFMSKMVLIDPDWQHKDKQLPSRFVVKILTQLAMQKLTDEFSQMHNVENSFIEPKFMAELELMQKNCHNAEVRTYNHLMKVSNEHLHIPKVRKLFCL
ncbi:hypothetical protein COOONC_18894 [Cooperia oncophora]